MIKVVSIGLVVALIVAWFALFFSNRAVLVGSTAPENGLGMLECRYFTGTGITKRSHIYKNALGIGIDTCPRLVMAAQ